jgi:hypothetical protein
MGMKPGARNIRRLLFCLLLGAAGLLPSPRGREAEGQAIYTWVMAGIGDCAGPEIGQTPQAAAPPSTACTAETVGVTAVCWGNFMRHAGGFVGCTYKRVPARACTGGASPGSMFECRSMLQQPVGGAELFSGWETGVELRDGGDYESVYLQAAQPDQCLAACGRDPRCGAVTYEAPGTRGVAAPICWLKEGAGRRVAQAGVMSAVKQGPGAAVPALAGAPPRDEAGQCDITGLWNAYSPGLGASEWWIAEGGAASQIGAANAAGAASLASGRLSIRWAARNGSSGDYAIELEPNCVAGRGRVTVKGPSVAASSVEARFCRNEPCR